MTEKLQHPTTWLLAGLLLLPLVLVACGTTAGPAADATDTPPLAAVPAASMVGEGKALLADKGCASCHGANGEGVENLGPALPGHSGEVVFNQVREPRQVPEGSAQMPAFGVDQISDEELEKIVAFIESLGPPMGAGPSAGSMTEAAHLRLTLVSLEAGSVADAMAHIQDLIDSAEGETKEKVEQILVFVEDGDVHEAEHELETMLAQTEGPELTAVQLHIVLTLDALQKHADDDAITHLENAIDVAVEEKKLQLERLLADLKTREAHAVEHELERLLGEEPHGL
ncbi:c-type cytochrome [Chloroflexota bacterium]